jgi:hypothetical protein
MVKAQCELSGGTMSAGQCTLPSGQVVSALGSQGGGVSTPPVTYTGQYQQILSGPVTSACPGGTDQYGNCMATSVLPYGTQQAAPSYGTQQVATPAAGVQAGSADDMSYYL